MDSINLIASWAGWPIIVAVLMIAGGYAGWLLKNRIDHLKEINDDLKQKLSSPSTQALPSPDFYGIRILSPGFHDQVGHSFKVKGVLREVPKGVELWVFTCKGDSEDMLYWPQEPAKIQGNAWFSRVNNVDNGAQRILLFLVGEYGRILIHYFKRAGKENNNWPGLTELPPDIIQCGSVEVIVV